MAKWKKQNLKPKQCSSFPKNTAVQTCSGESVCCNNDNTEIAAAMKKATFNNTEIAEGIRWGGLNNTEIAAAMKEAISNKTEIPAGMKWASFNNIEITAGMREAAFNNTEIATGMKRAGYNTIQIAAAHGNCYRDEAGRLQ